MTSVWRELLVLPTLLWLALQDKKYLGIGRLGLLIASGILLIAGCFDTVGWQSRVGGLAVGSLLLMFGYFSKEAIGTADGVIILVCGAAFGLLETVTFTFFATPERGLVQEKGTVIAESKPSGASTPFPSSSSLKSH